MTCCCAGSTVKSEPGEASESVSGSHRGALGDLQSPRCRPPRTLAAPSVPGRPAMLTGLRANAPSVSGWAEADAGAGGGWSGSLGGGSRPTGSSRTEQPAGAGARGHVGAALSTALPAPTPCPPHLHPQAQCDQQSQREKALGTMGDGGASQKAQGVGGLGLDVEGGRGDKAEGSAGSKMVSQVCRENLGPKLEARVGTLTVARDARPSRTCVHL